MTGDSWTEKRRHKRFPKTLIVKWQPEGSSASSAWKTAFLKDISRGGLAMQCGEAVTMGDKLRFQVTVDLETPPFTCVGQVVRVRRIASPAGYDIGILFTAIDPRDADCIDMLAEGHDRNI